MKTTDEAAVIARELKELYRKWPDVKSHLKTLGCGTTTAEDIFQEALLIYFRKRKDKDFLLNVEPFFYVKKTCKLLWYNQSRKEGKQQTFELETDVAQLEDDWFRKEMKIRTIETALQNLGKQCRELLELFYGFGWNMVEIAKKIGLRNDKVAKAQKYRCLQKAKELVEANHSEDVEFNTAEL